MDPRSEALRAEILDRSDSSTDDLLLTLAGEILVTAGPIDDERKRSIAKAWIDAVIDEVKDSLCSDTRIQALKRQLNTDEAEKAAIVADALAALVGVAALATASVLIVRFGLERLCG